MFSGSRPTAAATSASGIDAPLGLCADPGTAPLPGCSSIWFLDSEPACTIRRVCGGVRRRVEARLRDADAWTAARGAGDSVAEIAHAAGVSPATVSRATSGQGPFPKPAQPQDSAGWARRRLDGEPVAQISSLAGVSTTTVYAATKPFGPFPTARSTAAAKNEGKAVEWAALRRSGTSILAIARRYAVPASTVSRVTRPLGPFPPSSAAGAGTVSLRGISRARHLPALLAEHPPRP